MTSRWVPLLLLAAACAPSEMDLLRPRTDRPWQGGGGTASGSAAGGEATADGIGGEPGGGDIGGAGVGSGGALGGGSGGGGAAGRSTMALLIHDEADLQGPDTLVGTWLEQEGLTVATESELNVTEDMVLAADLIVISMTADRDGPGVSGLVVNLRDVPVPLVVLEGFLWEANAMGSCSLVSAGEVSIRLDHPLAPELGATSLTVCSSEGEVSVAPAQGDVQVLAQAEPAGIATAFTFEAGALGADGLPMPARRAALGILRSEQCRGDESRAVFQALVRWALGR